MGVIRSGWVCVVQGGSEQMCFVGIKDMSVGVRGMSVGTATDAPG